MTHFSFCPVVRVNRNIHATFLEIFLLSCRPTGKTTYEQVGPIRFSLFYVPPIKLQCPETSQADYLNGHRVKNQVKNLISVANATRVLSIFFFNRNNRDIGAGIFSISLLNFSLERIKSFIQNICYLKINAINEEANLKTSS